MKWDRNDWSPNRAIGEFHTFPALYSGRLPIYASFSNVGESCQLQLPQVLRLCRILQLSVWSRADSSPLGGIIEGQDKGSYNPFLSPSGEECEICVFFKPWRTMPWNTGRYPSHWLTHVLAQYQFSQCSRWGQTNVSPSGRILKIWGYSVLASLSHVLTQNQESCYLFALIMPAWWGTNMGKMKIAVLTHFSVIDLNFVVSGIIQSFNWFLDFLIKVFVFVVYSFLIYFFSCFSVRKQGLRFMISLSCWVFYYWVLRVLYYNKCPLSHIQFANIFSHFIICV